MSAQGPLGTGPTAVPAMAELPPAEGSFAPFWRRFRRNRMATGGLALLALLYGVALLAPWLGLQPVDYLDFGLKNRPPSLQFWFGTDHFGRDVFARILWGSRVSLSVGLIAAGVSVTIGTLVGAVAGFFGGTWLDITMMRLVEAVDAFPFYFLLVVVMAFMGQSTTLMMIVIGVTSWPQLARLVRGQVLSLRERDFALASRALGAGNGRIIFRHILPNAMAPVIVAAALGVGNAILAEAVLNFLGFGTPPPYPTWGEMINVGREFLRQAPWVATFPGIFITMTVLAFTFLGNGLRDALDPKLKV